MLQHKIAAEGRELFEMLYPQNDEPAGIAGRLRAKGYRLMRSSDKSIFHAGLLLHGMAEAAELRLQKALRHG